MQEFLIKKREKNIMTAKERRKQAVSGSRVKTKNLNPTPDLVAFH